MVVIADAIPLPYLTVIGQAELLPTLFGEVWAPAAVLAELSAAATPDGVRELIESRPRWLRTQEPSGDVLQTVSRGLDRGERAAIALAIELTLPSS